MRLILQRTLQLLRNNPVLWLPVLAAAVVQYIVSYVGLHLRAYLTYGLMPHEHSVFTGAVLPVEAPPDWWIALCGVTITFSTEFIGVAACICALGILARTISGIENSPEPPDFEEPHARIEWVLPSNWARYSFILLLIFLAITFTEVILLVKFFGNALSRYTHLVSDLNIIPIALIFIAPVMTYIGNNLVRLDESNSGEILEHPRRWAVVVVTVFCAVYVEIGLRAPHFFGQVFQDSQGLQTPVIAWIFWLAVSLVISAPFVPMMILLVLLRQQEERSKDGLTLVDGDVVLGTE